MRAHQCLDVRDYLGFGRTSENHEDRNLCYNCVTWLYWDMVCCFYQNKKDPWCYDEYEDECWIFLQGYFGFEGYDRDWEEEYRAAYFDQTTHFIK